jgi:hypothetical protein
MAITTYPEVLKAAQQLPWDSQAQLAETLLRHLRLVLQRKRTPPPSTNLAPLMGVSVEELRVLAKSVLAADYQQQLHALLEKNRSGTLSAQEERSLDSLLAEADSVALLKARSLYTLQLSNQVLGTYQ